MGKVKTSFFRATDPSATVQYVRPNQTFPTAALIDYVVNRDAKPQVARKGSFMTGDDYKPEYVQESGNYSAAPADDCVDFKAANYILQRRLSLEYDSD
ncbi:Replicase polyprotein 1ab [Bienertia sinuspersici]